MIPLCTRGPDGSPCGNIPGPGEPFRDGRIETGAHCVLCWHHAESKKPQPEQCPHRGEPTGELLDCPTCKTGVKIKVFACDRNGRCTLRKKVDGVALCDGFNQ